MPNWAECRLWVNGDLEQVEDFYGKLLQEVDGEIEMDYSILVPLNEEGTYDYNAANRLWGTKWCGSDVKIVDWRQIEFQSPWSGPDTYVSTVSSMYPGLTFELTVIEGGCDFSYKNVYQNGLCSEVDGGSFVVLCEEFGYEICDKCECVMGWSCECAEEDYFVIAKGVKDNE